MLPKKKLPSNIKVAVVDDQALFRAGIISLLKDYDNISVIMEAPNGKVLLEQLKRQTPHLVLLDIEMPEMNGVETTVRLREKYPDVKIIILTLHNEEGFIYELITRGANGFLPKDKTVEEVVDAIYAVMETGEYHSKEITRALLNGSRGMVKGVAVPAQLTDKELEVLRLICEQKTNKEIAELMSVSTRTVETHRDSLLNKTEAKNTAGLVMYAMKNKLFPDA